MIAFFEGKKVALVRENQTHSFCRIFELRKKYHKASQIDECLDFLVNPISTQSPIPYALPEATVNPIRQDELESLGQAVLVAKRKGGDLRWSIFDPEQGWLDEDQQIVEFILKAEHPKILKALSPQTSNWIVLELDVSQVRAEQEDILIETALIIEMDTPKSAARIQMGITTRVQMIEHNNVLKYRFKGVQFGSDRYSDECLLAPDPAIPGAVFCDFAIPALKQIGRLKLQIESMMRSYAERNIKLLRDTHLEHQSSIQIYFLGA